MASGAGKFVSSLLVVPVCLVALAGCSPETAGEPQESDGSDSMSPSEMANGGDTPTLEVSNPLDVGPFTGRPCDLVPEHTVNEFGGGKSREPEGDLAERLGPSCTWDLKKQGRAFHASIGTIARDMGGRGLAEIYENVEAGIGGYVEPTEVPGHPGYPAAFGSFEEDKRSEGYCPLNIGTSDDMVVTIRFENLADPTQACPAALKVAASVLDTLKKGS